MLDPSLPIALFAEGTMGLLNAKMAEGILRTLIEIGPKTLAEPEDYDSRANLYWCATMALNGVIGVMTWA